MMVNNIENHSPNPNFTQHHQDKIDAMEKDVEELKSMVHGNEVLQIEGLGKRVKALETGFLRKILRVEYITCVAILAYAIVAVFDFFAGG